MLQALGVSADHMSDLITPHSEERLRAATQLAADRLQLSL